MHVRAIPTHSLCIADWLKGMIIQVLSQLQKFSYQYKLSRAHDDIVIIVAEKEECVTYSPCGCVDKDKEKFRAGRLLLQVLDKASIELTFYFGYTQEILPVSKFCTFFLLCHNNNDVIMCSWKTPIRLLRPKFLVPNRPHLTFLSSSEGSLIV